jgi:hypothetical protein
MATTAEIVEMPYDEAVIECIKIYHAIPTVKAMLTGKSKEITNQLLINKLHNANAAEILNASTKILKSVKLDQELNFSMSPELANAIGTVVVQALQENAKAESNEMSEESEEYDANDLPESSRDAGLVDENEGPKYAPDLSAEVNELKSLSNHSDTSRYGKIKDIFNFSTRMPN